MLNQITFIKKIKNKVEYNLGLNLQQSGASSNLTYRDAI